MRRSPSLRDRLAAESRALLAMLWAGYTPAEAEEALRAAAPQARPQPPPSRAGQGERGALPTEPSTGETGSSASTSRACPS